MGFQRGKIKDTDTATNYLKFYAYLQTLIDDLTGDIINAMRSNVHVGNQLEDDTYYHSYVRSWRNGNVARWFASKRK